MGGLQVLWAKRGMAGDVTGKAKPWRHWKSDSPRSDVLVSDSDAATQDRVIGGRLQLSREPLSLLYTTRKVNLIYKSPPAPFTVLWTYCLMCNLKWVPQNFRPWRCRRLIPSCDVWLCLFKIIKSIIFYTTASEQFLSEMSKGEDRSWMCVFCPGSRSLALVCTCWGLATCAFCILNIELTALKNQLQLSEIFR